VNVDTSIRHATPGLRYSRGFRWDGRVLLVGCGLWAVLCRLHTAPYLVVPAAGNVVRGRPSMVTAEFWMFARAIRGVVSCQCQYLQVLYGRAGSHPAQSRGESRTAVQIRGCPSCFRVAGELADNGTQGLQCPSRLGQPSVYEGTTVAIGPSSVLVLPCRTGPVTDILTVVCAPGPATGWMGRWIQF
jgi:hypothetical protein